MGYRVKKVPYKKGCGWKLQIISYVDDVTKTSDVPKEDWLSHGFSASLSIEDARKQASSLNRTKERKRQAERTQKIKALLQQEEDALNAHFPSVLLQEFEKVILRGGQDKSDDENIPQLVSGKKSGPFSSAIAGPGPLQIAESGLL